MVHIPALWYSVKYPQWFLTASEQNHEDADCFVLAILSHGDKGVVCGTDGTMPLSDVCRPFHNDSCPSLQGKPKIFILQASFSPKNDDAVILKNLTCEREIAQLMSIAHNGILCVTR